MKLETGKLDSELLKKIVFGKITYRSEDVSVRPGIGEDCAVMDFGDHDCIMSTDPISSAVSDPYHVQRYCFQRCSAAGDHAGCHASGGDDG